MKVRIAMATAVTVLALSLVVGSLVVHPRRVLAETASETGERTVLKVRNRTPWVVFVYVGGVRVGWMRSQRTGMIRGLSRGYHKLYAHTQFGTTSWGPREIWVPGTWNLQY